MPFQNNDALPVSVKNAIPSKGGKDMFREVVNSQLDAGKSETVAFSSAWAALQDAGFEQNDNGKWVKKADQTSVVEALKTLFGSVLVNKTVTKSREANVTGKILKADEEQRIVWGWASVVTEKGKPVVDAHEDVIEPEEMEKMANEFMLSVRRAKAMHKGGSVGEVIHSLPLTDALAKLLGITSDREGWIIAMKIHDDDVWQRVKSGELGAFSIGGQALTEEIEDAE